MKAAFPYDRLGPRGARLFGYDRLWVGPDHLLAVHNRRFVEEYRRFEWREIQAIVIRKQPRFIVPVYWLAACAAAFALAMTGTVGGNERPADAGWTILIVLGVYWLRASIADSCVCHIQTAVGSYELPGLYRRWTARRALRTLEARISEAQGTLPDNWAADAGFDDPAEVVPQARPTSGRLALLPALACVALLADALLSWLNRAPRAPQALQTSGVLVTVIAVILPVVSIAVFARDRRFHYLRNLFLLAVLAVGLANWGNYFVSGFLTALQAAHQQPMVIDAGSFFYWLNQIAEVSAGLLGLTYLLGNRQGRQISAP